MMRSPLSYSIANQVELMNAELAGVRSANIQNMFSSAAFERVERNDQDNSYFYNDYRSMSLERSEHGTLYIVIRMLA